MEDEEPRRLDKFIVGAALVKVVIVWSRTAADAKVCNSDCLMVILLLFDVGSTVYLQHEFSLA